jgi:hypothetical protein
MSKSILLPDPIGGIGELCGGCHHTHHLPSPCRYPGCGCGHGIEFELEQMETHANNMHHILAFVLAGKPVIVEFPKLGIRGWAVGYQEKEGKLHMLVQDDSGKTVWVDVSE